MPAAKLVIVEMMMSAASFTCASHEFAPIDQATVYLLLVDAERRREANDVTVRVLRKQTALLQTQAHLPGVELCNAVSHCSER